MQGTPVVEELTQEELDRQSAEPFGIRWTTLGKRWAWGDAGSWTTARPPCPTSER